MIASAVTPTALVSFPDAGHGLVFVDLRKATSVQSPPPAFPNKPSRIVEKLENSVSNALEQFCPQPVTSSEDGASGVSAQPAPLVTVVIPARNEARNLPHVLSGLPEDLHQVILVDGHSVDGTVAAAIRSRPDIHVVTQTRTGKGNALACGFAEATGDIIVMLDADGSSDPAEIPTFVDALLAGADLAKGTRFGGGGTSTDITRLRAAGNHGLNLLVNGLYGARHTDLCYGYMAFWRSALERLDLPAVASDTSRSTRSSRPLPGDGFEIETLLVLRAMAAGLTVVEVGSVERQRMYGASHLNAVRDGVRVVRTILEERRRTPSTKAHVSIPRQRSESSLSASGASVPQTVAVIIACYSDARWELLQNAIRTAADQTRPTSVVVVVDNNERLFHRLVAHCADALADRDVTVLRNTRASGASGARNTGAHFVTTDVIAFLDDDAWAEPDWIAEAMPVFQDPAVVGVGGDIAPIWESGRPAWFPDEFGWVVGATLPVPASATPVRNVWACNMVLHRDVFLAVGGFREGFGKLADYSEPEDTDLCIRVSAAAPGRHWARVNGARVHHAVPGGRSTYAHYFRRCWNEGAGKARLELVSADSRVALSSERDYLTSVLPRGLCRNIRDGVSGDLAGLARAGFILTGTTSTLMGFASTRERSRTVDDLPGGHPSVVAASLPVLMYHSTPAPGRGPAGELQVPLDELRRHLQVLSDDGWELLGLSDALAAVDQDPARRVAALTFDDGYRDFLGALDVLDWAGAGATLYVPTARVGTAGPDGTRFLDWAELAEVAARNVEIGSHAHHHIPLDTLGPAAVVEEVRGSRTRIEDRLERAVVSFCFPHGYTSQLVRAMLAASGYRNACTVGRRVAVAGDDVLAVPRLQVRAGLSDVELVTMLVRGEPGWTPVVKQVLQPAWRVARLGSSRVLHRELS